ncbi:MAG: asparagine synthase (glutamine-hydrolyzing), partial [Acidobacteriota bacterium]|nr:asparagine synthase (glutamine-hydrolyzing) [Acidobacteriota bacterium]
RGPDDEGIAEFGFRISELGQSGKGKEKRGALSLGMRRLSIIDLEGGHQPIFNEDGKVGVVLNGEIYNFRELTRQLEDRGHTFRTRSDSEVVAHAYEEWGASCVERLEGMFAIAVYDQRNGGADDGKLFIARDRLGIKPLYYSATNKQFVFASEVRTLLASGVVPRQLSRTALESYLLFGSVSEPMTLVEGVLSLPPGHRMTVDLNSPDTSPKPECYWNIATVAQRSPNGNKTDRKDAAARVRALLEQSVRKHLIADVPVGVFLSSGIDSTALAALASREVSGVHTFTVGFPEKEFSEAAIARRTAERFGTTHQEVMLDGDEMLARLGEAVDALDQPTMDGINTYFVSWSARQAGLKVALSGLGGDEVFGGYNTFSRTAQYQRMAWAGSHVPAGLKAATASVVTAVGNARGGLVGGDVARKLSALWNTPKSLPDPFYFGRNLFTPSQVSELLPETNNGHARPWWDWLAASAAQARTLDSFAAVSCMEAGSYLVNTLLRDTDFMSMAHSLEVRVPFLDHPLVEFVTQLPQEIKVSKGTPKALLVAALQDLLPAEVVNQTKRGFTFPWAEWLRGPLKESIDDGFSHLSPALANSINGDEARGIWRSYLDRKTSWSRPWSLYVLNEWTRKHL